MEYEHVQQIVAELRRLADLLARWPQGPGTAPRGADPAKSIVSSLKTINSTLEKASAQGRLTPEGYDTIGREFEKIGATLRALGGGSKAR